MKPSDQILKTAIIRFLNKKHDEPIKKQPTACKHLHAIPYLQKTWLDWDNEDALNPVIKKLQLEEIYCLECKKVIEIEDTY